MSVKTMIQTSNGLPYIAEAAVARIEQSIDTKATAIVATTLLSCPATDTAIRDIGSSFLLPAKGTTVGATHTIVSGQTTPLISGRVAKDWRSGRFTIPGF
jgi:hypothetical protein